MSKQNKELGLSISTLISNVDLGFTKGDVIDILQGKAEEKLQAIIDELRSDLNDARNQRDEACKALEESALKESKGLLFSKLGLSIKDISVNVSFNFDKNTVRFRVYYSSPDRSRGGKYENDVFFEQHLTERIPAKLKSQISRYKQLCVSVDEANKAYIAMDDKLCHLRQNPNVLKAQLLENALLANESGKALMHSIDEVIAKL